MKAIINKYIGEMDYFSVKCQLYDVFYVLLIDAEFGVVVDLPDCEQYHF